MKCDQCSKESQWLEIVGSNFVCYQCINKNKVMGFILRTNADIFRIIVKKLVLKDYPALLKITRTDVDKVIDLKKCGIILKTTNIVHID